MQKPENMSVAEMKLQPISEISKLNSEKAIQQILEHLSSLNEIEKNTSLNLSQHYDRIAKKYGGTLAKLAK